MDRWGGQLVVAGVLATTTVLGFSTQALGGTAPTDTPTPPAAAPTEPAPPTTTASVTKAPAAPKPIDCRRVKCVALTFDDGPGPYTTRLLAMLHKAKVHVTFFSVGEMVAARPGVEKQIAKQGHEIGNHSWSHPDLPKLTNTAIESQVNRTAHAIVRATGEEPTLMRPPYGAYTPRVRRLIGGEDDAVVLWSVDPLDWKYRNSDSVYHRVTSQTRPGSIVLMHDIHGSTVAAVPRIIATLKARHYHFVTVSELYRGHLTPGHVYTGREGAYHPKASSPARTKRSKVATPHREGATGGGGTVFTDPGDDAGDQRGGGVASGNSGSGGSVGPGEGDGVTG